jgi:nucleoside-diphosphate-sugar epimerase
VNTTTQGATREPIRVGVTGALGFVAFHLIPRLLARGDRVTAIVRPGRDAARLERAGVVVRRADLGRPDTPSDAFLELDALVHLSGMAQVPAMMPAMTDARLPRGVFVGSTGVHTQLDSRGAEAKRAGERALRDSPIAFTILRPTMIYGTPADRNLVRLLRWLERWSMVPVPGGGETLQQPVHVLDLCAAILAALDRPDAARREYDIGGPYAISLRELIHSSATAVGRRVWCLPLPIQPTFRLVALFRSLRLPTPVSGEQVLRLAESKAVDIAPAARDLDFAPRNFADGIREEVRMLRSAR